MTDGCGAGLVDPSASGATAGVARGAVVDGVVGAGVWDDGAGDPPQAASTTGTSNERMPRRYAARPRSSSQAFWYPDEMSVRFVDRRSRAAHASLTPIEQQQLDAIGPRYFGGEGPASIVDDDFEDDPMESRSLMAVDTWRGVDGDRHVYDAWFYMGDSGTIFRAGTTEVVADIIQCGLQCPDPDERAAIGPAMVEAKLLPKSDLSYQELAALLAAQP